MPSYSQRWQSEPSERKLKADAKRAEELAKYESLSPKQKLSADKKKAKQKLKAARQKEAREDAPLKLAKREAQIETLNAKLEQASKRVTIFGKGNVVVAFDGENSITVRRGLFVKRTYKVDEQVSAVIESGGNLRTHPTLTRTIAGFGAAWKKTGSLFLLIDGRDWAELVELNPKKAHDAQKFAQQVNLAARLAPGASAATAPSLPTAAASTTADTSSVIDQLERLTKLREQGVLTEEEFAAEKQRILNR